METVTVVIFRRAVYGNAVLLSSMGHSADFWHRNESSVDREQYKNESSVDRAQYKNESSIGRAQYKNESSIDRAHYKNESSVDHVQYKNESSVDRAQSSVGSDPLPSLYICLIHYPPPILVHMSGSLTWYTNQQLGADFKVTLRWEPSFVEGCSV